MMRTDHSLTFKPPFVQEVSSEDDNSASIAEILNPRVRSCNKPGQNECAPKRLSGGRGDGNGPVCGIGWQYGEGGPETTRFFRRLLSFFRFFPRA
jgi:hypothetical protein